MSRRIINRTEMPAFVGRDSVTVQLAVQVCGPASGRSDGKPSREPWPAADVVVITPASADDDGLELVEDIKLPLWQLRAVLRDAVDASAHDPSVCPVEDCRACIYWATGDATTGGDHDAQP